MEIGGGGFCEDCGWQECQAAGICIRPFVSPVALLGLDLTPLEAIQLLDELASAPPKRVFLGEALTPAEAVPGPWTHNPDDIQSLGFPLAAATDRLTGVGESSVVALTSPAPTRRDDGATLSSMPTASPPTDGTSC